MSTENNKKRKSNWTSIEKLHCIELIINRADKLFGKFRGATSGAKEKEKMWCEIADELNSCGKSVCNRTVAEIKKMYNNTKGKAKEKVGSINKTGGGPAPELLSCEKAVIDHMSKAQLEGVSGGIDSDKVTTVIEEGATPILQGYNLQNVVAYDDSIVSTFMPESMPGSPAHTGEKDVTSVHGSPKTSVKPLRYTKRKREQHEADLYRLERRRAEKELEKMDMEMRLIQQKTLHEDELHILKKTLLEKQINSMFDIHDE